jgi:sulfate/thiosulfate transport system permease protein
MVLFYLMSRSLKKNDTFSIKILNNFELLLAVTLYYGIFILALPVLALLYKTKQQSFFRIIEILKQPIVLSAYKVTFLTAFIAALINALAGLILAWVLVRYHFYGKKILDVAIDLPFALPTSVGGLTLMTIFSGQGWMGPLCSWLGIQIVFNQLGVLVAMIFVSIPFVVRTVQPILEGMEEELEEAALCVGASSWTTFWEIIFPPLAPSLFTGTALGFSRAIGEYGSIILIASNIPTKDLVISVLISQKLEQYDYQGATIIATGTLLVSFGVLLIINTIQFWYQTTVSK